MGRRRTGVLMIVGYFDETENSRADFVAMSGYLADHSNWDALSTDWDLLLKKHKIPYLHVKDFLAAKKVYEDLGWNKPPKSTSALDVLGEFIDVICKHTIMGVGIGVDAKKYREILKDVRKKDKPEVFCFERTIRRVLEASHALQWEEPLAVIFDDCEQYSMKAYANLCEIQRRSPELRTRIGMIGFGNDEIVPPLQAADVLAYATQRLQGIGGQDAWLQHPQFSKLLHLDNPAYGPMYVSEFWDIATLENEKDKLIAIGNREPFVI